ncbi:uncharacterized protein EKO05_0002375 [Ascochyta rabiei]|uniref:Uncharacterized protein n=1 Tax=Didymella rabiei TaxID=5454 RepID=A0A162VMZ1_DIDRA|nr:uncharacterized protein EKO05_0002375 [Ascochyta rabiei]KZM18542.1 hypothetical protein ST47_g10287 [Ascochyta rabiei]UPX11787.1 hypothetical protein EKO05_0002375 [Ascochyta rabiei]
MDASTAKFPTMTEVPFREQTVYTKPTDNDKNKREECTCDTKPVLVRKDSIESIDSDYPRPRRAGRVPPPPRHYPAPAPPYPENRSLDSATQLLEKLGKEDGLMELPTPAHSNVYLTTYPFGDKDVKKWAWLLAAGVEEEYLAETSGAIGLNGKPIPSVERVRQRRNEFPVYDPGNINIPSVYLSRALDVEVAPEDSKHNIRYLIVVQNRHRPAGSKLLVAESRKAAGVIMYYEALRGESVVFVGATVHQCKTAGPNKFRKVASLEEAASIQDEGYVGVVC